MPYRQRRTDRRFTEEGWNGSNLVWKTVSVLGSPVDVDSLQLVAPEKRVSQPRSLHHRDQASRELSAEQTKPVNASLTGHSTTVNDHARANPRQTEAAAIYTLYSTILSRQSPNSNYKTREKKLYCDRFFSHRDSDQPWPTRATSKSETYSLISPQTSFHLFPLVNDFRCTRLWSASVSACMDSTPV